MVRKSFFCRRLRWIVGLGFVDEFKKMFWTIFLFIFKEEIRVNCGNNSFGI